MGVSIKDFGEVQPRCNSCGVALCWSIDSEEYLDNKSFWDAWKCRDCNPDYEGAYKKYKSMKTACFTGHRPNKLNGYNPADNKELLWKLHEAIVDHIENKGVSVFITGMALGIDTWAAKIVLKLKEKYPDIHLVAAVPCKAQDSKWIDSAKKEYNKILDKCDDVYYVSNEPYTMSCMQDRNEYMVDNSEYIIAVWDGTNGGTGNCVKYAKKKEKQITYIDPQKL